MPINLLEISPNPFDFATAIGALPAINYTPGTAPTGPGMQNRLLNLNRFITQLAAAGDPISTQLFNRIFNPTPPPIGTSQPLVLTGTSGAFVLNLPSNPGLMPIGFLAEACYSWAMFHLTFQLRNNIIAGVSLTSNRQPEIVRILSQLIINTTDTFGMITNSGFDDPAPTGDLYDRRFRALFNQGLSFNQRRDDFLSLMNSGYTDSNPIRYRYRLDRTTITRNDIIFEWTTIHSLWQRTLRILLTREATNLFQAILPGVPLPQGQFLASGNGTSTQGLFAILSRGNIFFNYQLTPASPPFSTNSISEPLRRTILANNSRTTNFRLTPGVNNILHLSIHGLDGNSPLVTPGPLRAPTIVTVRYNGNPYQIHFAAQGPAGGPYTYSIIPRSPFRQVVGSTRYVITDPTGRLVLSYDIATNDFVIVNSVAGNIRVQITSGNPNSINPDEIMTNCTLSVQPSITSTSTTSTTNTTNTIPTAAWALTAENLFGDDEYSLSNAQLNSLWSSSADQDSIDAICDLILNNPTINLSARLFGNYVGQRARPFDPLETYYRNDIIYHDPAGTGVFDTYECLATSTSGAFVASNWNQNFLSKVPRYNSSNPYTIGSLVYIHMPPTSELPARQAFYRAIDSVLPMDPPPSSNWRPVTSVNTETNANHRQVVLDPSSSSQALSKYHNSLRYSFVSIARVANTIRFIINSYCSPVLSRLDKRLAQNATNGGGPGLPIIDSSSTPEVDSVNEFNEVFTTWEGGTSVASLITLSSSNAPIHNQLNTNLINTSPLLPDYNIPLCYLRSFGMLQALRDRFINRLNQRGAPFTNLIPQFNALFDNAVMQIPTNIDQDEFESFDKSNWDLVQFTP